MFSATWAAGKITGMKELIESLTRKVGDQILDKKLENMLDSAGCYNINYSLPHNFV